MRVWNAAVAALPFLALLVLLNSYVWPLDHAPTSRKNDIHTYHAPNIQFLAAGLRENGELPRWNPQDFAGTPLVADPQAGVYNPVHWLLALRPSLNSFGWLILGSAALGALGFLYLARAIGCALPAAAGGAIAFVLGGKALFHLVELGHTVMAPFFLLPWVLLGCLRCVEEPKAPRIVATAGVLAVVVVGMHPQILVYAAVLLAASCVFVLWRRPDPFRGLATLGLVAIWSAALAAVHLLPVIGLLGEFARSIPALHVSAYSGAVAGWLEVATGAARSPEERYYFGGVTLFLAFVPFLAWGPGTCHRATAWFQGGVALALLAYGTGTFGELLVEQGGVFRHPARVLIVLGLPSAILVALGMEALVRSSARRRRSAVALAGLVAFAWLIAARAVPLQLALLLLAIGGALVLTETRRAGATFAGTLMVLGALGFDTGSFLAPSVRTAPAASIGRLPTGLVLPPDLEKDSRIAEPRRELVIRGIPELEKRRLGLESLTGYNPLIPWRSWSTRRTRATTPRAGSMLSSPRFRCDRRAALSSTCLASHTSCTRRDARARRGPGLARTRRYRGPISFRVRSSYPKVAARISSMPSFAPSPGWRRSILEGRSCFTASPRSPLSRRSAQGRGWPLSPFGQFRLGAARIGSRSSSRRRAPLCSC
jgi:hypothetical protein